MTNRINFLFPSLLYFPKEIDFDYAKEADVATSNGFGYLMVDIEALKDNTFSLNKHLPALEDSEAVFIYRGWMLNDTQYQTLEKNFAKFNAKLITSRDNYFNSHHLPRWYESIKPLTISTVFTDVDNYIKDIQEANLLPCFIKDYVKSLTTSRGSICKNIEEAKEVVDGLKTYRGFIEGGICVRELIDIKPETEQRYFVYKGKAFAPNGQVVPEIVQKASQLHKAPFFSVDTVEKKDGTLVIIEFGDGQVSDIKNWNIDEFYQIFKN